MRRRTWLRLMGLAMAMAMAPATATVVPAPRARLAAAPVWWVPVEWWTQEFFWGTELGVAVRVRHVVTGATRQHAVVLPLDHARDRVEAIGRQWLTEWAARLPHHV